MEAVKKSWFWGIFISILSIFAMSYNANAITPVLDLNNYDTVISGANYINECTFTGGSDITSGTSTYCSIIVGRTSTSLNSITTSSSFDIEKGDVLNYFLLISSSNNQYFFGPPKWQQFGGNIGWDLISLNEISVNDYIYKVLGTNTVNPDGVDSTILNSVNRIYEITMRANRTGSLKLGLYSTSAILSLSTSDYSMRIIFSIRNFSVYRYAGSEENKEVLEKTQEAVDDSQAAGGSSSQDAQTGTTGLLNAITGAVSVISSASPTNCKINGNMGNLDIGQLDLCANPAPAFVQTIGSLILILMCVPLAISLFNRFISIFRSFQS